MKTGLVSVTFRALSVEQIIDLCKQTGISAIEWGSDVHAKNQADAEKISTLCRENDMMVASLGSYYVAGAGQDFAHYQDLAKCLGAPNIRVWAGKKDCEDCTEQERQAIIADLQTICDQAKVAGIDVSVEYHQGTLTNTQKNTVDLLKQVNRDNFYTYWQPLANTTFEENLVNIQELCALKKLKHVHAYHWVSQERKPFAEGRQCWEQYLKQMSTSVAGVFMEFVKGDSQQQFLEDASLLKEMVR